MFDHIVKGTLLAAVLFLASQVFNQATKQAVLENELKDVETRELERVDDMLSTMNQSHLEKLAELSVRIRQIERRLDRANLD